MLITRIENGQMAENNSAFIAFYTKPYHHYQTSDACRSWGEKAWFSKIALLGVVKRWDFESGFVGGAVDKGETLLEAAVRECREEVGGEVSQEQLTLVCSHEMKNEDTGWIQNTHFYVCEVTPEEIYDLQTRSMNKKLAPDARTENAGYTVVHMVDEAFTNLLNAQWAGTAKEELRILFESGLIARPVFEDNGVSIEN